MKQDMNGVRSARDLEQKYDFAGMKKAVKLNEEGINKTNTELENFVNLTASSMNNLQEQIDGNITTHYYSGVPTLTNLPVSEWEESKYNVHLGDLYYDKDTGYAYRFYLDSETNTYGWIKLTDSDVIEALALANSAKDTADNKRRVFTSQPIPPYDNGDLWINDMEIYICQITKSVEETYAENDFIIATKYTDNTYAYQVNDKLTIVEGTVQTIEKSNNELNIEFVKQQEVYDALNNKVVGLEGTLEDMSFNFSTKGLSVGTSSDETNSLLDNTGIKVYGYTTLTAIFNNKGSGIDKLIVTGTAQLGYLKIMKTTESGTKYTDIFHLENLIEDLEDLL